jgi:DNA gyrase subunit A
MSDNIERIPLHETAQERYLNYAMSVITSRALPDVRDGLKPVQRRILYAMFKNLNLDHEAKPRKSAAIVGEVMGKYHPHGDKSIYDAMVRMSQSFSMRMPLVDGHGNFGSLDGDSAAAMRYTEARLTSLSSELLGEINQDTVDFRSNYDGTEVEPLVLPAQVPNLLINGATGIAVGMATNIPPHNIAECLDALIAYIEEDDLTIPELVDNYVQGPDFPTGGVILNSQDELKEIYKTGSGTINLRSNWETEKQGRTKYVVITSIPYSVNKSSLVEDIADCIVKGEVPQIADVRDESTDDVRILLQLKRGENPETALAYLFKHTKLETRFHVNLTALVPESTSKEPSDFTDEIKDELERLNVETSLQSGNELTAKELVKRLQDVGPNDESEDVPVPKTLNLKQIFRYFLDFRMQVLVYRLLDELRSLLKRIHILEAYELIFDDLDKAIELVRSSESRSNARDKLMDYFSIDTDQANAILDTKIYRLAKFEIENIREELEEKRQKTQLIRNQLLDKDRRWTIIKKELIAIRKAYSESRRTDIDAEVENLEYTEKDYIVDEDVWVIVSEDGWIKRQKSYTDVSKIRTRDNDSIQWVLPARTPETVIFFTNHGKAYTMRVDEVPDTTGHGDPLQAIFRFSDGEQVVGVLTRDKRMYAHYLSDEDAEQLNDENLELVAMTEQGRTLRFTAEDFTDPSTVKGRMFMRLDNGDQTVNVEPSTGEELVSIASRDGRGLNYRVDEISQYKGVAKGVMAMSLEDGDEILDFTLVTDKYDGLEVETNNGRRVTISASKSKFEPSSRGNKGHWIIKRGHLVRSHRPTMEIKKD